jgi:hypothetical protein
LVTLLRVDVGLIRIQIYYGEPQELQD